MARDADGSTNGMVPQSSHWGTYWARADGRDGVRWDASTLDPHPSDLMANVPEAAHHATRVTSPAVRAGWLRHGPGPDDARGSDEFVAVGWDELEQRLAAELDRVYRQHGPQAVYGGSYGWASAGRFHHAQSQLHRFLNTLGGYVASLNNYSTGASTVALRHVLGPDVDAVHGLSNWQGIRENTELVVAFGGMPLKNMSIAPGGLTRHTGQDNLAAATNRGVEFVLVSPLRDDLPAFTGAQWLPIRPGSDCALMLALVYVLIQEDLADTEFLHRYCVGYERFRDYVLGADDGVAKTPAWAADICGLDAADIVALARRMARRRTFITVTWSLQRGDHGEQPAWMAVALAATLGQIGLPGGGFGHGYGSMGDVGNERPAVSGLPTFPQGNNGCDRFIPVSRVADMLLAPGTAFDYDGHSYTYPRIRLVYWCGGNPFHHHQDLGRLTAAFRRVDTVVVHDPYWTATARQADIVVPSTIALERNDIGASRGDPYLVAMHRVLDPVGSARDDYETFAALAARLGRGNEFTQGRSASGWVRQLYSDWQAATAARDGFTAPEFDDFWDRGWVEVPRRPPTEVFLGAFRADPDRFPLGTPSGRIEIHSETVAAFGYSDCWGHPAWFAPREWLDADARERFPVCLVANQPRTRLHSQLDVGGFSMASKVQGHEPARINPVDAAARDVGDGDVIRIFNDRGSCLAGAVLSNDVAQGVVQLSTGAWYDPAVIDGRLTCLHGNPNVLTADRGTSSLAQSCSGAYALVEFERFVGDVPPVRVREAPKLRRPSEPGTASPGGARL